MRVLIGIDDTDNKETRGTGYRARLLATRLQESGLARVAGITRHQLFVAPEIPYTSHNSSATLDAEVENLQAVVQFCKEFLLTECAEGSDPGLCVVQYDTIPDEVVDFGKRAKDTVLNQKMAIEMAASNNILLMGLGGTNDGIIGALAGVGLRKAGNDGRFLWLNGELKNHQGIYSVGELKSLTGLDEVTDMDGKELASGKVVDFGEWIRPVLRKHKSLIVVEPIEKTGDVCWKMAPKEYVKSISQ
ncbi:MAG: hypothetical protein KKD31_16330 [Bacteroidetes bacterium]|nr:hypothetical protein [Bacteroidota bacterium]